MNGVPPQCIELCMAQPRNASGTLNVLDICPNLLLYMRVIIRCKNIFEAASEAGKVNI